jgi:hypothetical protein
MFPGMTISVSCLKFDSHKMTFVDFAHKNVGLSTRWAARESFGQRQRNFTVLIEGCMIIETKDGVLW